jgi:protein-glutamine gamma-glutamyltransferase
MLTEGQARSGNPAQNESGTCVDHFFEVSLLLLLGTGFATLATTGKLDTLSIALVFLALAVRLCGYATGRDLQISSRTVTRLAALYIPFFFLDFLFFSAGVNSLESILNATIHLVLFTALVKAFSARTHRGYVYLAALSLLIMLASAVLTINTTFLVFLAFYFLFAIATFASYEIRRSIEISRRSSLDVLLVPSSDLPGLQRALAHATAFLGLGIAVAASLFFFAIPRYRSAYLAGLGTHMQNITGFSESVKLGDLSRMMRSGAVVFRVLPENNPRAYIGVKWRGLGLDSFDGKHWYNGNTKQTAIQPVSDGRFIIPREPGADKRPEKTLHYKVLLSPIPSDVVFAAACARRITGRMRLLTVDETDSLHNMQHAFSPTQYSVVSQVGLPSPAALRSAPGTYSKSIRLLYLRLPPKVDPRIHKLAEKVTSAATDNYDRAMEIQIYLRDNFGYTLEPPEINSSDPIGSFLFTTRKGYCEYFASAMAIMLRTLGIPARLVNGFQTGSYNRFGKDFVVRARDAHSWVEVYFPQYGWVPFDPTPPDPHPVIASELDNYVDALNLFWSEWIINYDFSHQMQLATQVEVLSYRVQKDVHHHFARLRTQMAGLALRMKGSLVAHKFLVLLAMIGIALGMMLGGRNWNLQQLGFLWACAVLRSDRPPTTQEATASYHRFLNILEKKGFHKFPWETPQEFARKLKRPPLAKPAQEFTRLYNAARYGGERPSLALLRGMLREISEIAVSAHKRK